MLKVGDAAPDFVLKDADGQDIRLSSFTGKNIVLYFYPRDNTPGCTIEAMQFRNHHEGIEAENGVLVGVSLDSSKAHCSFRDRHGLPFHLLSDSEGHAHDLYGAWRTQLFGRNSLGVRRCTYLIDRDGVIRRVYKRINVLGHAKQVVKDMALLNA